MRFNSLRYFVGRHVVWFGRMSLPFRLNDHKRLALIRSVPLQETVNPMYALRSQMVPRSPGLVRRPGSRPILIT
jgi:hypothetical protein